LAAISRETDKDKLFVPALTVVHNNMHSANIKVLLPCQLTDAQCATTQEASAACLVLPATLAMAASTH
jgi:hypothetical protein